MADVVVVEQEGQQASAPSPLPSTSHGHHQQQRYKYFEADVFTSKPGYGNPVAIVLLCSNNHEDHDNGDTGGDAEALTTESMQRFANWTNFSETVFVTDVDVDTYSYTIRIFTPFCELPFAGHPSVGTAQTLLQLGLLRPSNQGLCIQNCAVGALPLKVSQGDKVSIRVPRPRVVNLRHNQSHLDALRSYFLLTMTKDDDCSFWIGDPMVLNVGPTWLVVRMSSRVALNNIPVQLDKLQTLSDTVNALGVTAYAIENDDDGKEQVWVRSLCPEPGVTEDPVCGSGNGTVGYHRLLEGTLKGGQSYVARQGEVIGRDGYVYVDADEVSTTTSTATSTSESTTSKLNNNDNEQDANVDDEEGKEEVVEEVDIWVGGYAQVVVEGHVRLS
jgi:PhzF family phenazine biosynthesis protein